MPPHSASSRPSPPDRARALAEEVTIDLDTTDVEVYGRLKQGVAFNHQGQRVGRPHVAWRADTSVVLAADLGDGWDDPRTSCAELLGRALAALPSQARTGRIQVRADAGYFAGQLARACLFIGASSPSAPGAPHRCGGCSTVFPPTGGPTRST